MVKEPGFEHAVKWVLKDIDYADFCNQLLLVKDGNTFQKEIMMPFLELLVAKTTSGLTCNGLGNIDTSKAYTFITNHRDIVLDTSFLNLCFFKIGIPYYRSCDRRQPSYLQLDCRFSKVKQKLYSKAQPPKGQGSGCGKRVVGLYTLCHHRKKSVGMDCRA